VTKFKAAPLYLASPCALPIRAQATTIIIRNVNNVEPDSVHPAILLGNEHHVKTQ